MKTQTERELLTQEVISRVPDAADFGISSVGFICGELDITSEHYIDVTVEKKLHKAALKVGAFFDDVAVYVGQDDDGMSVYTNFHL